VGIIELSKAIAKAMDAELDLVEVAPNADPPVCRIMDYGKYLYSLQKKEHKARAHQHKTELKEIRIRTPKIGEHDLMIKVNHAREFLEEGHRVRFSLRFRGRELAHVEEGYSLFDRIKEGLSDVSKVIQDYTFQGRKLSMLLASDIKAQQPTPEAEPAPEE
jgi:translation initiation factor IF-3